VLPWALDRVSREGMVPTIQHLKPLSSYVTFRSYTEPHLYADSDLVLGILLAVLATMAKHRIKASSVKASTIQPHRNDRSNLVLRRNSGVGIRQIVAARVEKRGVRRMRSPWLISRH
jgi:hypothetical protein